MRRRIMMAKQKKIAFIRSNGGFMLTLRGFQHNNQSIEKIEIKYRTNSTSGWMCGTVTGTATDNRAFAVTNGSVRFGTPNFSIDAHYGDGKWHTMTIERYSVKVDDQVYTRTSANLSTALYIFNVFGAGGSTVYFVGDIAYVFIEFTTDVHFYGTFIPKVINGVAGFGFMSNTYHDSLDPRLQYIEEYE